MWLSIIFIILAGVFSAVMDVLSFRWDTSIFKNWKKQQWINPSLSWENKWKPKSKLGDKIMSTILVWVTDMWHFSKMLMILCMSLGIVFYQPMLHWVLDTLIFYCLFTITFELFFSIVLIKKPPKI